MVTIQSTVVAVVIFGLSSKEHSGGRSRGTQSTSKPSTTTIKGQAIFCLHDSDSQWVQGYFVPEGSSKPWGLLAVQEEIDDCLACADGGYRRVTLTVYPPKTGATAGVPSRPQKLRGVDWTGGDMMTLYHPDTVEMNGEQLLTGDRALVVMNKYFQGLLRQLHIECKVEEGQSVLDWLPNVAVVKGSMDLTLPANNDD
ncbi:MAG: hypothetical protein SGARI_004337 [Bacillariaceae sp.]